MLKNTLIFLCIIIIGLGSFYLYKQGKDFRNTSNSEKINTIVIQDSTSTFSEQLLIDLVKSNKEEILKQSGTSATDITNIRLGNLKGLTDDVHMVEFTYVDNSGNKIASESGFRLIGKVNNSYVIGAPYGSNYCIWLSKSIFDEATQAYLGLENCKK